MIYKLIILTASLLFIWEFMKVRSTAVAQLEPKIIKTITDTPRGYSLTPNPNTTGWTPYGNDDLRIPIPDLPWLKLNGVGGRPNPRYGV